jgi:hypothetical protein
VGGSSTTTAEIPLEYKYLSANTGNTLAPLQRYLWGSPTDYGKTAKPTGGGGGGDPLNPIEGGGDLGTGGGYPGGGGGGKTVAGALGMQQAAPGDIGNVPRRRPYSGEGEYEGGGDQAGLEWLNPHAKEIADYNEPMWDAYESAMEIKNAGQYDEGRATDFASQGTQAGGQDVADLVNFENNPLLKAGMKAFETNALPMIQNQNELAGFGHTNVAGKNIADAFAGNVIVPAMQSALQTRRDALNAQMGGKQFEAGQQMQIGGNAANRLKTSADTLWGQGTEYRRDVTQAKNEADYNDYIQRKAFAESALMNPLGNFVPSTIGSTTKGK